MGSSGYPGIGKLKASEVHDVENEFAQFAPKDLGSTSLKAKLYHSPLSLRDQDSQGWITDKRCVLEATCLGLCCSNILS
jgi:hypothetical protein